MVIPQAREPSLGALASDFCSDTSSRWCPGPRGKPGAGDWSGNGAHTQGTDERLDTLAASHHAGSGLNTTVSESRLTGHKATLSSNSHQMHMSEAEPCKPQSLGRVTARGMDVQVTLSSNMPHVGRGDHRELPKPV